MDDLEIKSLSIKKKSLQNLKYKNICVFLLINIHDNNP